MNARLVVDVLLLSVHLQAAGDKPNSSVEPFSPLHAFAFIDSWIVRPDAGSVAAAATTQHGQL
jgi:hypothetical protein